jgi:predicted HD superfamily hydrolase involved in NAD metabolism
MIDDALLDSADGYARDRLSDKRYAHTLRVADTAEHLARLYDLDPKKACLAALLHDSARETSKEELLRIAGQENIVAGQLEREQPLLLHGPVAAELSRRELGVEDEEVLEAVRHHTTGAPGMGPLSLALYVADKIEPDRDQPGVDHLRKLALEDLRRAATAALEDSASYSKRRGQPVHPKSGQALKWLKSAGGEHPAERRM